MFDNSKFKSQQASINLAYVLGNQKSYQFMPKEMFSGTVEI